MAAVFVIVWLLCGILCAVIAQSKGRSVGGFAVLGVLTGLIGVIVVALARPQAEIDREQGPVRRGEPRPDSLPRKPLNWTD